jgi:hypothetical protein
VAVSTHSNGEPNGDARFFEHACGHQQRHARSQVFALLGDNDRTRRPWAEGNIRVLVVVLTRVGRLVQHDNDLGKQTQHNTTRSSPLLAPLLSSFSLAVGFEEKNMRAGWIKTDKY